MEYFVEQAATHREAEEKIRLKYGSQARIMHHRSVRIGGFLGLFTREGVEVTGYFSREPRSSGGVGRPVNGVAQSGTTGPTSVQDPTTSNAAGVAGSGASTGSGRRSLEEEKKRLLETMRGGGDKTLETVLTEIRSLRDSLGSQSGADPHPVIAEIRERLEENDFSPSYTRGIVERMRKELSMEELDDRELVHERVIGWIGLSIRLHEPRSSGRPEVLILVGPTGVGKTTTIAKLAAMYGLDRNKKSRDIRVLTIDNYRIGARQQIETYGQIMDIPVSFVESADDMKKYLALYQDADMIFVDTIGKSPRDFRKLGEMNEVLSMCGSRARVHLAISATTKTCDVAEIATQFEPFKYEAVVITKMDETTRAGNIISVLAEREKPISFITDGQRVPQDIERATRMRLLMHLEGFDVSRAKLEKQFSLVS
ncbi:MAG: flagellar biosynthesis protein FlhF [Spirochaetales bacterium]